jgi:hypothetical protein
MTITVTSAASSTGSIALRLEVSVASSGLKVERDLKELPVDLEHLDQLRLRV